MNEENVDFKSKRVPDLDEDDTMKRVQLMIPNKWYQRIGEIALEHECSRGSILREALRDYFNKIEKPVEPNPEAKISNEDLSAILDHCTTFFGGFEIDGEDGFIETMKLNNLKLKDLTPGQWPRVKEKIQLGYNGYFSPPEPEEFAEKFEDIEPSEEQRKWLSAAATAETEEE